jgi:SagB-type dehydrogenase family enzyme
MPDDIGDRFQRETKYTRGHLQGGGLDWERKPSVYKSYPQASRLALPDPSPEGGVALWETIKARRSVRRYAARPVSLADLSQLLWASQGLTDRTMGQALRSSPSAGALYPVETYLAAHNIEGLSPGIHHYSIPNHELEEVRPGDFRNAAARGALDQGMAAAAPVVFIWTAVFPRSKWKYRQRAYRYVYLDAGHIAQNLALAAVALGLGTCQIAALYDGEINSMLGIDGVEESVLYMSVAGHPG